MRIEIKKKGNRTAILVSFNAKTDKFRSLSERTKFFEELYGRNQTIKGEKKKYFYRRAGLMDEIPNIKVDNSVFIIAMKQMKMMEDFMNEWEKKVMFKTFPVLIDEEEAEQLKEVPVRREERPGFKLLEAPKKKKVI